MLGCIARLSPKSKTTEAQKNHTARTLSHESLGSFSGFTKSFVEIGLSPHGHEVPRGHHMNSYSNATELLGRNDPIIWDIPLSHYSRHTIGISVGRKAALLISFHL